VQFQDRSRSLGRSSREMPDDAAGVIWRSARYSLAEINFCLACQSFLSRRGRAGVQSLLKRSDVLRCFIWSQ